MRCGGRRSDDGQSFPSAAQVASSNCDEVTQWGGVSRQKSEVPTAFCRIFLRRVQAKEDGNVPFVGDGQVNVSPTAKLPFCSTTGVRSRREMKQNRTQGQVGQGTAQDEQNQRPEKSQ